MDIKKIKKNIYPLCATENQKRLDFFLLDQIDSITKVIK